MTIKKFTLAAVMTVGIITAGANAGFSEELSPNDIAKVDTSCPICQDLTAMNTSNAAVSHSSTCSNATLGHCANSKDVEYSKSQIYAYPGAIYGDNNFVGSSQNGVYVGNSSNVVISNGKMENTGVLVTDSGQITGAAASMPSMDSLIVAPGTMAPINIETPTSMEILQRRIVPVDMGVSTGGAATLLSPFDDIPAGFWASCDINQLANDGVVVGYPNNDFKPNAPISRAEFASMVVNGYNLKSEEAPAQNTFKDVPKSHWANRAINEGVKAGFLNGYSNDVFKPNHNVTRAEALSVMAKGLSENIDESQAETILERFTDAKSVPSWAKIEVAKALDSGALEGTLTPDKIMPNKDASRAEVASMLEQIRVSLGYDKKDIASCTKGENKKTYVEQEEMIKVPTLQLNFNDQISSKSSNVGDKFTATTIDTATINGVVFPAGSIVYGNIIEIIRPTKNSQGAIKLSFKEIKNGDLKADLPTQILAAQVNNTHKPNALVRTIEWPFTWVGSIVGTASRTVGGAAVALGNAAESMTNSFGIALGETAQGQFKAAGRSMYDSGKALVKAPVDLTRTALSGSLGLLQDTADEVTFLLDPKGMKVSNINPKERVTIAFGCNR